jgi:thymidylate synthase (FAD)
VNQAVSSEISVFSVVSNLIKKRESIPLLEVVLIAITPDAEQVIESAGRTCYMSFGKETTKPVIQGGIGKRSKFFRVEDQPDLESVQRGTNFNSDGEVWEALKVWPNSAARLIETLIKSGHHSVLEHASATFRVIGGSRALTHQLVRHRIASFSQQSQRYVDEERFRFIEPPSIAQKPEAHERFVELMEASRKTYLDLQALGIRNEDARFVLPNAAESEIVVTANLREWRHIIELRSDRQAQWEIRYFAIKVLELLKQRAPSVFFDMEITNGPYQ